MTSRPVSVWGTMFQAGGRAEAKEVAMAGAQCALNEGKAGSQRGSHRAGLRRPRGRVWILFSVQ